MFIIRKLDNSILDDTFAAKQQATYLVAKKYTQNKESSY